MIIWLLRNLEMRSYNAQLKVGTDSPKQYVFL